MIRPLIVIHRVPKIDFMRWHVFGFAFSILLGVVSIGLFLSIGTVFLLRKPTAGGAVTAGH